MEFRFDTPKSLQMSIVREKHTQLLEIMKEVQIDTWIVFLRETSVNADPVQQLIIGGDVVWESAFIFHVDETKLHSIAIIGNFDADAEENKGIWTEIHPYTEGITTILRDRINDLNPSNIGLNCSLDDVVCDGLSHGLFLKLRDILNDYQDKFISAAPIIQRLRARKTETEINLV